MKNYILLLFTFFVYCSATSQTISIAEARALPEGSVVTVTGTVTNGEALGIIRYFQDETAGIAAYGPSVDGVNRHDSVTISGELKLYNGLLEIDPITSLENHGPAVNPIQPKPATPNDINEENEGQLLILEDVVFANGGGTFESSTFQFSANGEEGVLYLRSGHAWIGSIIPVGPVTITGISSQFSFNGFGGYQLIPRDMDDLINENAISIVSQVTESNQSTQGYTLSWVTDVASSSGVLYSTDEFAEEDEMTLVFVDEMVTEHTITIEGLTSGQVYFNRAFSVVGADTAMTGNVAVVTVSESSGAVKAYFNKEVNHAVANPEDNLAVVASNIDDTIASYIDKAQVSLDIAVYNFDNAAIANAINAAYDRGVSIRIIVEGGNLNNGLNSINDNIPVLQRENSTGSGMHNKFMIIDADDVDNAWVMGGSTNFTNYNMSVDFNNVVFVQDQSLARAYRVEFHEMWGSDTMVPNAGNSRFGADKRDNTPHHFIINGYPMECYFSPSDGTNAQIIGTIMSAESSVYFATLVFTRDDIADAVIDRSNDFFVDVSGMIDQVNTTGSEYEYLQENFVNVYDYGTVTSSLHHKYVIVDVDELDEDPMVLTGSHNWSSSAENSNDENTLIIHDPLLVNQFYQEYAQRLSFITNVADQDRNTAISVFPNPTSDILFLQGFDHQQNIHLQVIDLSGRTVLEESICIQAGSIHPVHLQSLPSGTYLIQLSGNEYITSKSFVKY